MDKEKETKAQEAAQSEEKQELSRSKTTEPAKSWKSLLSRKWVFPAAYLGAAAIILAIIFWVQSTVQPTVDKDGRLPELTGGTVQNEVNGGESMPTATPEEHLAWPVKEGLSFTIARTFYDEKATAEEQAKAVIQYANGYYPNTGIDITAGDQTFDVLAAASGEVIRAEKDPVVGNVIWLKHPQGRVTVYESLADLNVKTGDQVKQGDRLGKAGRNGFGKDLGIHLHFEVRDQDTPVNPVAYLPEMK